MFTERLIFNPLTFIDGKDFVIIGANRIEKSIYEANKKEFDLIILTGDEAWKKVLPQTDIIQFIVKLSNNKVVA